MDTEAQAAKFAVATEIIALVRAGGKCSLVERHVEETSGRFLHLEAIVQCTHTRLAVDTAVLCGCPESTHWLLLGQQLQHFRAQFAARV